MNFISIKTRMLLYILFIAIVFATISYFSKQTLDQNADILKSNGENIQVVLTSSEVNYSVNKEYTQLLLDINMGAVRWIDAPPLIRTALENLQLKFSNFNNSLSKSDKQAPGAEELFVAQDNLIASFVSLRNFFANHQGAENREKLNTFANDTMLTAADVVVTRMNAFTDAKYTDLDSMDTMAISQSEKVIKNTQLTLGIGALIIVLLGLFVMISILKPTSNLTKVIQRLSDGEFDVRAKITGSDEIAKLSSAFNGLLDERAVTLQNIDIEHQELNFSVFSLLQSVAELSERDLTIRADVSEDATGPVADALNLLAEETSTTLKKVKNVAFDVSKTSQKVNMHIKSINKLAVNEHKGALETAGQMNIMLQRLDSISKSASATSNMANTASLSTKRAHESVTDTLGDMSNIRVTVQETGRRIRQLGERSEEISNVIDIINTIAERTTVLALNASMQAVKAGDAGKGFAVIAEEIQRLSETSRESTSEISTLVNNIQQETNTTIATMDKTIKQVIDGSTKAEDAVTQMQSVLNSTNELVVAVDRIATASLDQVSISKNLKVKAEGILESTQITGQELLSLTGLSRNMSEYAQQLVASVNVFTLEKKVDPVNTIKSA